MTRRWVLARDPQAIAAGIEQLAEWLRDTGACPSETLKACVTAAELLNNDVEHGGPPHAAPALMLDCRVSARAIALRILGTSVMIDPAVGSLPAPGAARGRGLGLVNALTDSRRLRFANRGACALLLIARR